MLERHKQIPEAEKQLVTQKQSFYRVARKAASSIILPHILFVTKLNTNCVLEIKILTVLH